MESFSQPAINFIRKIARTKKVYKYKSRIFFVEIFFFVCSLIFEFLSEMLIYTFLFIFFQFANKFRNNLNYSKNLVLLTHFFGKIYLFFFVFFLRKIEGAWKRELQICC